MYVHMWMEQNIDLHKKVSAGKKKGGASPKTQPQTEGYMSLALLKALYPIENSGNIIGDRGAYVNCNTVIRSFRYHKTMELRRLGASEARGRDLGRKPKTDPRWLGFGHAV